MQPNPNRKNTSMKNPNLNVKPLLMCLPYMVVGTVFSNISEAVRMYRNHQALAENMLTKAFANPLPSLHYIDLLVAVIACGAFFMLRWESAMNKRKYRKREEYGSAKWGTAQDIAPFIDPEPTQNIILSQTETLTIEGRVADPKYARNKNVLIIGGSGTGKTRFWLKPNLMQMHSSYVVTDPKGSILVECGKMLRDNGYRIKVLNTIDFSASMHYNPFAYIKNEQDIMKFVDVFIANTSSSKSTGDQFWIDAEKLMYNSLISYILNHAQVEEQNFEMLSDMMRAIVVREDDENHKHVVDVLFDRLEEEQPNAYAVKQYRKYKAAGVKTLQSVHISVGARLGRLDMSSICEITSRDDLELDMLGDQKTALFFIVSDTSATFNFLVAIAQSQMFNLLCEKADTEHGGRLPIHVRCLLDEFANSGRIPDFERLIATIRSREISACIVLQSQSQLKALYDKQDETIVDNCDTMVFLGSRGRTTLKEISEMLGKATIDTFNTGESRGREKSASLNYQKLGRELLTPDELAIMDNAKCIVQLRGVRPFFSNKYDITKHPQYRYLSDYHKKNAFDIRKYVQHPAQMRMKKTDEIIYLGDVE